MLKGIGAPDTPNNRQVLLAQATAENTAAAWNPLATTQQWVGSTPLSGNPDGVQNYQSFQDGVAATVKTLLNGRYNGIISDYRKGNVAPKDIVNNNAAEFDVWGTGAGNVLADLGKANSSIGSNTTTIPEVQGAVSEAEGAVTGGLSDIGKYVAYGAAFLGGSLLILLGIVLIGADIGLAVFARTKTANTGQKVVGTFGERKEQKQQREYRARTSERAEAIGESKRRTQAHRETLAKARTRTERARARNIEGTRPKPNPKPRGKEVVTGDKKTMTVIRGGQAERHSSNGTEFGY